MISSLSIPPTRLFPARKSKLFRQHCQGIPSETTSKTDSQELAKNGRTHFDSDRSAPVDRMRGWPKVPPAGSTGSSGLQGGRGLEACPTQRPESWWYMVDDFPGSSA